MRVMWALLTIAVMTVYVGALLVGDGAESGSMVLGFGDGHGVNRNDLPVVGLWLLGLCATGVLVTRVGAGTRRVAAVGATASSTVLLVMLLFGLGPGAEELRLAIAHRHGMNLRGLALIVCWAMGVYGTFRLDQRG